MVLLFVIEPEAPQGFAGVEDIMRAEAREQAQATLAKFAARARDLANLDPEMVIREGKRAEEIRNLIETDEDIAILVLAAGESTEGPGAAGDGDRVARRRELFRCRSPSCRER